MRAVQARSDPGTSSPPPFPPGVKYPLGWVQAVQARSIPRHRHMVLLDAAAYTPTNPLNLTQTPADFVVGVLSARGRGVRVTVSARCISYICAGWQGWRGDICMRAESLFAGLGAVMTAGGDEQGRCCRRPGLRAENVTSSATVNTYPYSPRTPTAQDVTFYKMFGYPTGLGALLVRTDAVTPLRKGERGMCGY